MTTWEWMKAKKWWLIGGVGVVALLGGVYYYTRRSPAMAGFGCSSCLSGDLAGRRARRRLARARRLRSGF